MNLQEIEQEVEEQRGKVASMQTAFESILSELKESNKHYGLMCQMTDTYHRALERHAEDDKIWRIDLKEFMTKIYETVWGNGKPGILSQMLVIWIGGSLLVSFVLFMAYWLFIKPQGGV
jgi:hypothetical protein